MERENNITEEEQSAEDDTFKFFIHKSDVLARILKDNIDELEGMSVEEIKGCLPLEADGKTVVGKDTEYSPKGGKKVILDSVFEILVPGTDDKIPIVIGCEGQKNPRPGYPLGKRAEYYLARMVSAQGDRDFAGDDYGGLKKTYSIWCVLEPRKRDLNTVVRYKMKAEKTYGKSKSEPEELVTFNVVMMYLGSYNDDLPDSLAIGTAMFSKMGERKRRELVKDRFKIELDDNELERLNKMTTLGKDKFEHGKTVGIVNTAVEGILFYMEDTGRSIDEALSRYPIPKEHRIEVESEVRKRLS